MARKEESDLKSYMLSLRNKYVKADIQLIKLKADKKQAEYEAHKTEVARDLASSKSKEEAFNLGSKEMLINLLKRGKFHCTDYSDGEFIIFNILEFDKFCEKVLGREDYYNKYRPTF